MTQLFEDSVSNPSHAIALVKAVLKKNSELIYCWLPVVGSAAPVGRNVASRQPDQRGGSTVIGEVSPRLHDLAQSGVHALDGVGRAD